MLYVHILARSSPDSQGESLHGQGGMGHAGGVRTRIHVMTERGIF